MANSNGMGPNNKGPLTGRCMGNCSTTATRIRTGLGMGLGLAWAGSRNFKQKGYGGRRPFNIGRRNNPRFQNHHDSIEDYKSFLEDELERINNQTNT